MRVLSRLGRSPLLLSALLILAAGGGAVWLAGCAANDPFDPASLENIKPVVRLAMTPVDTAQVLSPTSYFNRTFNWSGSDPRRLGGRVPRLGAQRFPGARPLGRHLAHRHHLDLRDRRQRRRRGHLPAGLPGQPRGHERHPGPVHPPEELPAGGELPVRFRPPAQHAARVPHRHRRGDRGPLRGRHHPVLELGTQPSSGCSPWTWTARRPWTASTATP